MRLRPLLPLLLGSLQAQAQLTFGDKQIIEGCETDLPVVVQTADLDGDGHLDLISGSRLDNRVAWYRNDGAGNFGLQQLVPADLQYLTWVDAADLDGDGDIDLLSGSWEDDRLCWYANDGAGNFSGQVIIATVPPGVNTFTVADLDSDSDLDVVVCTGSGMLWFPNMGNATFGTPVPISLVYPYLDAIHAACDDLDGDGDVDIVYANHSEGHAAVLLNDGDASFAAPVGLPGSLPLFRNIVLADLNGDGILDALGAASIYTEHSTWSAGVGDGSFLPVQHLLGPAGNWSTAADVDGDEDLDIVAFGQIDTLLTWSENDGSGNFGSPQVITRTAYGMWHGNVADVDQDGDIDVIAAAGEADQLTMYRNVGGGDFEPQIMITEAASWPVAAFGIDMDGDGDNDVVSASFSDHKLAWYANDGVGNFGAPTRITITAQYPESAGYADLDGDGDVDIVLGTQMDSSVTIYKNDGQGGCDETIVVDSSLAYATGIHAADLDGDGDLDLLSTEIAGTFQWYTNEGGDAYTKHFLGLTSGWGAVIAADLDNDGDSDLVCYQDFHMKWMENDGAGNFGPPQPTIPDFVLHPVQAADMDGDGDQDLVLCYYNTVEIALNNALTFTLQVVDDAIADPTYMLPVDQDGDGDMDLLAASGNGSAIFYYENLGGAVFAPRQQVSDELYYPMWLASADLSGDGVPDLIAASQGDNEVAWFQGNSTPIHVAVASATRGQGSRLMVSPNPMNRSARLVADRTITSADRIELMDGQGRLVRSLRGFGANEVLVERQGLAAGTFVARLVVQGRVVASVGLVVE